MIRTTTTTLTEEFDLNDQEIRQALSEFVKKKYDVEGVTKVTISPDNSWEYEGDNVFKANVTITKKETK